MPSLRTQADLRRFDPYCPPDWRHERVTRMIDAYPPGRCTVRDDAYVRTARRFFLRWRAAAGDEDAQFALAREEPGCYFAHLIREKATEDADDAVLLESRLLAGQAPEEIAAEMGTLPEAVVWYGKLYFDVTERLGQHDWVYRHVLLPAARRALGTGVTPAPRVKGVTPVLVRAHLDYTVRFFAYFLGPVAIEQVLSGFSRGQRARSPEDLSDLLSGRFKTLLKARTAQAAGSFEVTKYDVTELFALHVRLLEIERVSREDGAGPSVYEKNIATMLGEFPWAAGAGGRDRLAGTALGLYDAGHAELRDEEMLLAAAGRPTEDLDEVPTLKMPLAPPRSPLGLDGGRHADAVELP